MRVGRVRRGFGWAAAVGTLLLVVVAPTVAQAAAPTSTAAARATGAIATTAAAGATPTDATATAGPAVIDDIQPPHSRGQQGTAASCPTADDCFVLGLDQELAYTTDATAAAPHWTDEQLPTEFAAGYYGLDCPTADLCVAITGTHLTVSADPTDPTSWHSTGLVAFSVSCPSASLCLAVRGPSLYVSTDPSDPTSWTTRAAPLSAAVVSCATTMFCELGGQDQSVTPASIAFASTSDPSDPAPAWVTVDEPKILNPRSLSCPTTSLCVAGVGSSQLAVSSAPGSPDPGWTETAPQFTFSNEGPVDVSCGSSSRCVATASLGVIATDDPASGSWTTLAPQQTYGDTSAGVGDVCGTTGCLWLDEDGRAYDAADPATDGASAVRSDALGASSLTSVACPAVTLCVAGDDAGKLLTSTTPTVASSWTVQPAGTEAIEGIGCYGTTVCVAMSASPVNDSTTDSLLVTHDPTAASPAWTTTAISRLYYAGGRAVSCVSSTTCIATFDGATLTLDVSGSGARIVRSGGGDDLVKISCVSSELCVAADNQDPYTGPSAHGQAQVYSFVGGQDGELDQVEITSKPDLTDVACPSVGLCLATDGGADIHASVDPVDNGSWATYSAPARTTALSCVAAAALCAATSGGEVVVTSDPTGGAAAWTSSPQLSFPPTSISCPTTSWCLTAGGATGQVVDTTPGAAAASSVVGVTGTNDLAYETVGPPRPGDFVLQDVQVVQKQPDESPDGAEPPAVVDLPSGGPWPGQAISLYAGSEPGQPGVTVHTNAGSWFDLAGGRCLGVSGTVVGTTLDVACEGVDHALFTASTRLPLTTTSRLSAWVNRGGVLASAPAAATVGGAELVAVRGTSSRIYLIRPGQTGFTGQPWSCADAPALAGGGPGGLDVLACRTPAGAVQETTYARGRWGALSSLGGSTVGQPGVAFVGGVATFVAEGTNGQLYSRTGTTGWVGHGGRIEGGASIAATG